MKPPSFLFYSDSFLSDTMLMTDEQVGKYIRLLCAQHLKGRLTEKDMLAICNTRDEEIYKKFVQDEEGRYYNAKLEDETLKRVAFCQSRRESRLGKTKAAKNVRKTYETDTKQEKKIKYRDNIALAKNEYQKLCTDFGANTTQAAIDFLASYKIEKNYTTKSDYLTIRRWVIDAVTKPKTNGHKPTANYLVAADGSKIYEKDIDFSKLGK